MSLFTVKREVFTHHLFEGEEFSRREAWLWMISEASYAGDLKKRINGKTVILPRGTLSHSVRFMAEKWGWHRCKVERFLKMLVSDGMIKTETARKTGQTLITLCNYEEHTPTPRDRETKTETAARQQRDNITEDIGYIDDTMIGACASENQQSDDDKKRTVFATTSKRINDILMPYAGKPFDCSPVHSWLNAGADPVQDIIPTIRRIVESGKSPPTTLNYFEKPVMQALANRTRTAQIPEAERTKHGKPKQRHSGFEQQDYRAGTEGFDVLD